MYVLPKIFPNMHIFLVILTLELPPFKAVLGKWKALQVLKPQCGKIVNIYRVHRGIMKKAVWPNYWHGLCSTDCGQICSFSCFMRNNEKWSAAHMQYWWLLDNKQFAWPQLSLRMHAPRLNKCQKHQPVATSPPATQLSPPWQGCAMCVYHIIP